MTQKRGFERFAEDLATGLDVFIESFSAFIMEVHFNFCVVAEHLIDSQYAENSMRRLSDRICSDDLPEYEMAYMEMTSGE